MNPSTKAAIDAHLLAHREVLKRGPKLVKKGAR